jgi:hypothetical protein
MKTILLFPVVLMLTMTMLAQEPQTVMLDNNKVSVKDVSPELQFLFPDFQNGHVLLKDSREINCMLNYNFLLDEMLYIDENGKKMALANPLDIVRITMANRLFITTNKGYFEVIERGAISLVYKWKCHIIEKGKEGALGIETDAPSVYQMNQISFDSKSWKLDVDKEAMVSVEVLPYLKVKSKCILIKAEKDFLKAFSSKRTEIRLYLEKNPVDLRKEADLRRLTKYCNSL